MLMKNSKDTSGNRTHNLPACRNKNNRTRKTENKFDAFDSGLWEEYDTICYSKERNFWKENFLVELYFSVMNKDG